MSVVFTTSAKRLAFQMGRSCPLASHILVCAVAPQYQGSRFIQYMHSSSSKCQPKIDLTLTQDEDGKTPVKTPVKPRTQHILRPIHIDLKSTPLPLYFRFDGEFRKPTVYNITKYRTIEANAESVALRSKHKYGIQLLTDQMFNESLMVSLLGAKRVVGGISPENAHNYDDNLLSGYSGRYRDFIMKPRDATRGSTFRVVEIPEGTPIPEELILIQYQLMSYQVFTLCGNKRENLKGLSASIFAFMQRYGTLISPKKYADKLPAAARRSQPLPDGEVFDSDQFMLAVEQYEPEYQKIVAREAQGPDMD